MNIKTFNHQIEFNILNYELIFTIIGLRGSLIQDMFLRHCTLLSLHFTLEHTSSITRLYFDSDAQKACRFMHMINLNAISSIPKRLEGTKLFRR